MKIGIVDSGKGALAVLNRIMPSQHQYIILMDEAFFPYGNKSKEFLCKRSLYLVHFLIAQGVDRIILACNTLSLLALPFLKENIDFCITGVFDYLKDEIDKKNILMGSNNTCKIVSTLFPEMPTLDGTELILAIQLSQDCCRCLKELKEKYLPYDKLLLACTHFLFLKSEVFGMETVDPIDKIKEELKLLEKN